MCADFEQELSELTSDHPQLSPIVRQMCQERDIVCLDLLSLDELAKLFEGAVYIAMTNPEYAA